MENCMKLFETDRHLKISTFFKGGLEMYNFVTLSDNHLFGYKVIIIIFQSNNMVWGVCQSETMIF